MKIICCLLILLLLAGCSINNQDLLITQSEAGANADELIGNFNEGLNKSEKSKTENSEAEIEILRLTVPEGYTLARIGLRLEEMGVCTAEEFIAAAQTTDFSDYRLFNLPKPDTNRCFVLEGYLFPATYEIYSNDSPEAVIRRMLNHFEQVITPEILILVEQSGYTLDEILAIASIIEKEAFGKEVMPMISSVIYNRLEIGMRLQCDVTIKYVEGAIKPFITGDKNRYNEDYNTFKCKAIPAGAICNPGIQAIAAALKPADSDYFFFVTDDDKAYHFSETYEEHLVKIANIEKAKVVAEVGSAN